MKRLLTFVLLASLLGAPTTVASQVGRPAVPEASPPRGVRFYPRVGLVSPDSYFYEYFLNFTGDGLTEWTSGYLGRAVVAGAGAEVRLGDGDAFLRVEVLRSYDAWLSVAHSVETLRDLYFPPEIETTWLDVPATLTFTSLQLVLPTRLEVGPARPYVLVGGGGKWYRFGAPTTDYTVAATLPYDGFTWGGDLGAGVTVEALGLRLDLQARDAWSKYWGKTQHDLVYSGALSLGIF